MCYTKDFFHAYPVGPLMHEKAVGRAQGIGMVLAGRKAQCLRFFFNLYWFFVDYRCNRMSPLAARMGINHGKLGRGEKSCGHVPHGKISKSVS